VNNPRISGLLAKPLEAADLLTIVREHCPIRVQVRREAELSRPDRSTADRERREERGGAFAHLLEDGLREQDVEVRGELERRAEALDEGHRSGACPGHAQPPRHPALEGEEGADKEAQHLGRSRASRARQKCSGTGKESVQLCSAPCYSLPANGASRRSTLSPRPRRTGFRDSV
jgi:hypothetical protein